MANEECTHDCSTCGASCASKKESLIEPCNSKSSIKKVIGVVSGKGGVGKSMVSAMLAVAMRRREQNVAILDADITGPSVPKMFGIKGPVNGDGEGILPAETKTGIKVMSLNLLLDDETTPVVWRGPVIAGTVKQFWTDVFWGDIDWMFVDMPPGTGDVPLTVFQSLPIDGVVIVTTPQDLVSMIVAKAVNMAKLMNVPVLGIVENMSYYKCPDCGKEHAIFGESKVDKVAKEFGIENTARLPIDPVIAAMVDAGEVESVDGGNISGIADVIERRGDK